MNDFIDVYASSISTPCYQSVEDYLKSIELIEDFCFASDGDKIVVGVVTKPIFTLTGIANFIKNLENDLVQNFGYKEVGITFDTDLVYKIRKLQNSPDSEKISQIIDTIKKRR